MDPTSRENLSALMDGELAAEPTRFLLRRLEHDPDLSATWSRWHMVRACLASDPARLASSPHVDAFAARIAAALQAEAAPRTRQRHWVRYMGGGAIAASVAIAALLLNPPGPGADQPARVLASHTVPAPTSLAEVASSQASAAAPNWLLARQPTVLGAQPASANVVYGTGLMQPDYLRRASYARDATLPFATATQDGQVFAPVSILMLPAAPPPASSVAVRAH